jgi:hypothetical protein
MIYLKKYKTFENIFSDYAKEINEYESIKDYLKDIFLELEDEGFDIDIEGRWLRTSEFEELAGYEVKIKRSKTFLLEDIYDYILTCKSYLKEMGFFINGDISRVFDQFIPNSDTWTNFYADQTVFRVFCSPQV